MELIVASEEAMHALAARCAAVMTPGLIIYLSGPLGAGKTTFVRGYLRALGYGGAVRSPTYTLLEIYELEGITLCHCDLYRLVMAEELEFLGLRELLDRSVTCLVEWPDKGAGFLPAADLTIAIAYADGARRVSLTAHTEPAGHVLARLTMATPEDGG
jgi:tRNA threonylcarbamoyladenosine biosynthesis protein TsaE